MTRCPACGVELEIVAADDVRPTRAELIERLDPVTAGRFWTRVEELRQLEEIEAEQRRAAGLEDE